MLYILHCEIGCWHVLIYKSINLFHSVYTQQIKNEVDNKIVGVTQGSGKCLTVIEVLCAHQCGSNHSPDPCSRYLPSEVASGTKMLKTGGKPSIDVSQGQLVIRGFGYCLSEIKIRPKIRAKNYRNEWKWAFYKVAPDSSLGRQ